MGEKAATSYLQKRLNLYLPGYDHKGRKIILVRPGAYDPSEFDPILVQKVGFMTNVAMMKDDEQAMISGIVIIFDATGMGISHISAMPMSTTKKMNRYWQDGQPFMPKQFHQVNFPPIALSFFNTVSQFMKEKIRQRIVFHQDLESLHKEVPKYMLPKELGGDGPTIQQLTKEAKEKVLESRDFLIQEEKYKSIESKRPGKPKTSEDLFGIVGVDGSFRRLNID
ncbi:hypothetical protein QYM36_013832 [Artemia franciscana]|uniref:CRAL-TRIO domain-containing protein n=1 Tax=Artemia franciscana TaxID=6661 RepID=A0AA88HR41_ARTSF|nr:hypothetical protein QYM36_013832 [Artemia franciscana]